MAHDWFISRSGQKQGPFSLSELKEFANSGQLDPNDHLFRPGMESWVLAQTVSGLFGNELVQAVASSTVGVAASVGIELSSLALRPLCEAFAGDSLSRMAGGAVVALQKFFVDHSQLLTKALKESNDRAWKTIELALSGDSFWDKVRKMFTRAEDQAFLKKIREFLDSQEITGVKNKDTFRKQCLKELKTARSRDKLIPDDLDPDQLAHKSVDFTRYEDPQKLLDTEWALLDSLVAQLRPDFPNLASFVSQRPSQGSPLLVLAVRYYFRRQVEENPALFQGLTFTQLESLTQEQKEGFALLEQQGEQLASYLEKFGEDLEDIKGGVLRIEDEIRQQTPQLQQMYEAILELQRKLDLQGVQLRSGASVSIRTDEERREVKAFLETYRSMSSEERKSRPALLNAVAKLEVATGDFQQAEQDFEEAILLVEEEDQAEIHHNRYLSYLECRSWNKALQALIQAAQLNAERFAPFPMHKYQPQQILGAGGFGVAFRCKNIHAGVEVVLKTLRIEGTGMNVEEVFREAQLVSGLRHPAIIQVYDCDFADTQRNRGYIVMEYFPSQTLEEYVHNKGTLSAEDFLPLAKQIVQGLAAAHTRGIYHRDVKPANILVRQDQQGGQIKLIDFGLAVRHKSDPNVHTKRDQSTATSFSELAGTWDYAAPEQLGKMLGVGVGSYSDIYGFGKTCCFALFQNTQPLPKHFRGLPGSLAQLIEDCLEEDPDQRPQNFSDVLKRLEACEHDLIPEADELEVVEEEWYYYEQGQKHGPFSEFRMLEFIARGQLSPNHQVWKPGMASWVPTVSIPAFFPSVQNPSRPANQPPPLPGSQVTGRGPVTATLYLDGHGGKSYYGGLLEIFLDNFKLGVGSCLDGFQIPFSTTVGHHTLTIKGENKGMLSLVTGVQQVFSLDFNQPGTYSVVLGYEGLSGFFRKSGASGGAPPTSIKVYRLA